MATYKKIIYLDWNTFKGIKDSQIEPFISIDNLFQTYRDEIIILYSSSHLSDLNKDYEKNKSKIDSDLEFLKDYSDNIAITTYLGEESVVYQDRDAIDFFHEMRAYSWKVENRFRYAEQAMSEFAMTLGLDSNIPNWEGPIEKLNSYLPETLLGKSFSELIIHLVNAINTNPLEKDYYLCAYSTLGMLGYYKDKFNKKNKFMNSIQDGFHSLFGIYSDIFITNDRSLYYRSKALYEYFNINTKVLKTFKVPSTESLIKEIENIIN